MLHALKIVSQISDTINRILDENTKEHLKEIYHNEGLLIKMEIDKSEIFFLLRPKDQAASQEQPEPPEPADPEPDNSQEPEA